MKNILDWQKEEVVNIFDDLNIWSAPFGRMLLENIPMKRGINVLDIGFGTGFPLLELSQRFGPETTVYGIDIWKEAIKRTKEKIRILDLKNITILEKSASKIDLANNKIDLICSNLGVNNFEEREEVYKEIYRVLRPNGRICITTNPVGTFAELFTEFEIVFKQLNLKDELVQLKKYIDHRKTEALITKEFKEVGLELVKRKLDYTTIRFVDGAALLDHSLMRIGFRAGWEKLIKPNSKELFFNLLIERLNGIIAKEGEFKTGIPMLYLEFKKN